MALVETKKCLERRLMALTPSLPTAFEGASFEPPPSMYQRVQLAILDPDDPTFGTYYHRERLQLQIFITDVANNGTAAALARAELTRDWFKKGSTFEEGIFRIHILSTPHISSAAPVGNRTIIPVLIDVVTEVVS